MSNKLNASELKEIDKFIKFLIIKSTQVIVQSRLGSKIKTEHNSSGNDWFNIAICDHQDVLSETRTALHISKTSESIIKRLPLCVEISLQTVEGDKMILEVWSLSIHVDQVDPTLKATYAIYNRMGILLKSLIAVTRVTPAYKLSRRQNPDSYHIYYRIYCGQPQEHNLGEGYKQVRVGQLAVPLGTLNMAVAYRTTNQMTITPTQTIGRDSTTLILKSNDPHWNLHQDLSPAHRYQNYGGSKKSEKKIIDIDKPMRCGAFVDISSAKQYTEADFSLPETPPFSWLLRKPSTTTAPVASSATSSTTTSQNQKENSDDTSQQKQTATAGTSPSHQNTTTTTSRWRTLPAAEDDKLFKELHFPFATQNTPISDLAKFYRECFNAPPLQFAELDNNSPATEDVVDGSEGANHSTSPASETIERHDSMHDLTKQLEQFETSLPDYDKLVTSLCQQIIEVDSNSNS